MHHIVSDGWSMGIFLNELSTLYGAYCRGEGDPQPELEVQYADYAVWQRKWMEGEILRQEAEYWKEELAGAPAVLELPGDHARPAEQDYSGGFAGLELNEELTAGLKELSRRQGTTLFMTLLAGWAVLLSRLSGQEEVVIGTPVANRGGVEIEGLIGFFVNTLAVRLDLSGSPTVSALLQQVKEQALKAQQHQDIPFEQVVEIIRPVRSLAHSPVFQVMFAWQNTAEGRLELSDLEVKALGSALPGVAKFDLSLTLGEAGKGIAGGVEYATSLFEGSRIERYLGYFHRLLEEMVADDAQMIDRLPLLSDDERDEVLYEWNATEAEYPREKCIHELFEEQAERTPEAVAVVYEDSALRYGELNRRANQLGKYMRELGVKPDERVGICVERSLEMVVGLLGVLKAGGAYVPLDPAYPVERLRYMLEDSGAVALLTQGHLKELFHGAHESLPVINITETTTWSHQPESNPDPAAIGLTSEHLVYVIYTSGSTGAPKGVMVTHSNLFNTLASSSRRMQLKSEDRIAFVSGQAFDISLWELLALLIVGGAVEIWKREQLLEAGSMIESLRRMTVLHAVPSLMWEIVSVVGNSHMPTATRLALTGGDTVRRDLIDEMNQAFSGASLGVLYGPTEAAILATGFDCRSCAEDRGNPPIGRPITNVQVYILDGQGEPVPVGVTGELYIGGAGVARGYLNRRELTAERFVPDPFAKRAGARMYKTGDLGRWLADGNIEFLGRNDFQVKIRGFRIELGEIEARLREHPEVREAVVMAREDMPGEKRLVAYYTCPEGGGGEVGAEQLRTHLAGKLPEYMVPAAYVRLERMPLTANGKLDRKALPEPEADAYGVREYEAPVGEVETILAQTWAEVLKVERVGRHDNFFELGGHSLLAVRVISRLRQALSVEVKIGDLFIWPVLAEFARGVKGSAEAKLPPITRADRSERIPLSFAQQRLWFLAQMEGASEAYHISFGLRLIGELDRAALRGALDRIVARHEALRTSFIVVDGEPLQRIASAEDSRFHLVEHDLGKHSDAQGELERLVAEETRTRFDLERGPLIRGRLIREGEGEHALLLTMHHIVSDGWSRGIFLNELSTLYGAYCRGEGDPQPELEVQYADYAVWQRKWMEGEILRQEAEYWKEELAGAPAVLELPGDHARPAEQDYSGGFAGLELNEELTAGLKELSRRQGTTLFMTLLAGWAVLLSRLSGQEEVVIGTPVANRGGVEI